MGLPMGSPRLRPPGGASALLEQPVDCKARPTHRLCQACSSLQEGGEPGWRPASVVSGSNLLDAHEETRVKLRLRAGLLLF